MMYVKPYAPIFLSRVSNVSNAWLSLFIIEKKGYVNPRYRYFSLFQSPSFDLLLLLDILEFPLTLPVFCRSKLLLAITSRPGGRSYRERARVGVSSSS
jgi:hypothetical protein